ncbi:MAG: hypothetical protein RL060_1820 [Bacteroidota bacterium]
MNANQHFVIISITPWDFEMGNNAKNLAIEMSKNQKVIYVNPPLDRFTLLKEKNTLAVQKRLNIIKGNEKSIESINENLWVFTPGIVIESINWIPFKFMFDFVNKVNNVKLAKEIKKATHQLGFDDFYLLNDSDMFRSFHLKELLHPIKYIYYSRDNLMAVDYWRKFGQFYEPALIKKADVAIANSLYLSEELKKYNTKSYDVGQGCDLEFYATKPDDDLVPEDMKHLSGPIVGYTGALFALRLDIELIAFIAQANPEWNIVLVGPEDEAFKNSVLHQLSNVYFLGNKAPSQLRTYIESFDVCINPQVVNEVTIGNYPRKIDEYLAVGKPIVATATKAMEIFSPLVLLAENYWEYIAFIKLSLMENSSLQKPQRQALAASHSWSHNVQRIYEAIEK